MAQQGANIPPMVQNANAAGAVPPQVQPNLPAQPQNQAQAPQGPNPGQPFQMPLPMQFPFIPQQVPPVPQPLNPAAAAVPFSIGPALGNTVIDYSTSDGVKLFKDATRGLEDKYNGDPEGLMPFLQQVALQSKVFGWARIIDIPVNVNGTLVAFNLLKKFGQLSIDQVQLFYSVAIMGRATRERQDDAMLFLFLSRSITRDLYSKMLINESQWVFNGNEDSGICFLKVLTSKVFFDTRATSTHVRQGLIKLGTYMKTVNGDIDIFNTHVAAKCQQLAVRGESVQDLLHYLFEAYKSVEDGVFAAYIHDREARYNEGEINLTPESLMHLALLKFKELEQKGTWSKPSPDRAQIIALQATVAGLTKKMTSTTISENSSRGSNNNNNRGTAQADDSWKLVPNKDGSKTLERDGKIFNWCPNHAKSGKWVIHKLEDCNSKRDAKPAAAAKPAAISDAATAAPNPTKEGLRLNEAWTTVIRNGRRDE
jgi:hypothetical protein